MLYTVKVHDETFYVDTPNPLAAMAEVADALGTDLHNGIVMDIRPSTDAEKEKVALALYGLEPSCNN